MPATAKQSFTTAVSPCGAQSRTWGGRWWRAGTWIARLNALHCLHHWPQAPRIVTNCSSWQATQAAWLHCGTGRGSGAPAAGRWRHLRHAPRLCMHQLADGVATTRAIPSYAAPGALHQRRRRRWGRRRRAEGGERLAASSMRLITLLYPQPYLRAAAPAANRRERCLRARSASAPPGPCRWPDAA